MKKILILTAGYGEGHNSAARGVREGLIRVAPGAEVDLRDFFAETFGAFHQVVRKAYAGLINRWPRTWGYFYRWLDRKDNFDKNFARFSGTKRAMAAVLDSFQPNVVVSAFPAYPYFLDQVSGITRGYKSVAVVTDSITVNAIWYRSRADFFLLPNEQSADVLRRAGISEDRIKVFGFPVSPVFADFSSERESLSQTRPHVLYMINAGTSRAPDLVDRLLNLPIDLTVTVGRDKKLRGAIERVIAGRRVQMIGWTDQMPRLLSENHLLIGKAGGATVQETIAACCPMIINHVVSGQEEGNAQLVAETNSGAIALSNDEVVAQIERAFADNAKQWSEWSANIARISRPRASLEIAQFLVSI